MATESFFKTFRSTPEGWMQVIEDMMSDEPSKIQQEILSAPRSTLIVGQDITLEDAFALFGSEASERA